MRHAKARGIAVSAESDLYNPELLNTLPYVDGDILFDPADFTRHMGAYIPVVRVIDFDNAEVQPDRSPTDIWQDERKGTVFYRDDPEDKEVIKGVEAAMREIGTMPEAQKI